MADTNPTPKTDQTSPEPLGSRAYMIGLRLGGLLEAATTPEHPRNEEATALLSSFMRDVVIGNFDSGWTQTLFHEALEAWRVGVTDNE